MPARQLGSTLSHRVARINPFQGGPELQAWLDGSLIIATTWGDRVSRLAEHLGEPVSLETLLGKLCVGRDVLQDPGVHFKDSHGREFETYQRHFQETTRQELYSQYAPDIQRLELTLDAILGSFRVEDHRKARAEADKLQETIDATAKRGDTIIPLVMRREALRSGVVAPLQDIFTSILEVNAIHEGEFMSELAPVWVRAFSEALDDYCDKWRSHSSLEAKEAIVGRQFFDVMRRNLTFTRQEEDEYTRARWEEIQPVFITRHFENHPLLQR